MQGVYTYIPEKNRVPGEHCVAALLMLLFMVRRSLVPALPPSLLLLLLLLLPVCMVFTVIYLKQTMFLGYIVPQLFCIHNLCYM